ncbi:MAG: hypothetical protein ABI330_17320 [Caldimonas sp.]
MTKQATVEYRERQGRCLANIGMNSGEQLEEITGRPCQRGQRLRSDLQIELGLLEREALQPQKVAPAGDAGPSPGIELNLRQGKRFDAVVVRIDVSKKQLRDRPVRAQLVGS